MNAPIKPRHPEEEKNIHMKKRANKETYQSKNSKKEQLVAKEN